MLGGSRSLGREFGWLWAAYAVSAYGSGIGFGAFPLIAIRVLHTSPAGVSALLAVGPAIGALVGVPLGPWVEFRRKRPVMMASDLIRFAALMTVPAAYALGRLTFAQLLVVSVVVAAAKIAFTAASGANLKALVKPEDLMIANGRLESTNWTSIVVGPPLGGAAVGLFGPVTTMAADAVSYLLSACGVAAIRRYEPPPASPSRPSRPSGSAPRSGGRDRRVRDLLDAWRYILGHPELRPVFFNNLLVGGLILATEPLLAVLLLGQLGFAPWQYTVAFGVPCVGGFIGSRLAWRLVARFGRHRMMMVFGTLCAVWPLGLAFVPPGTAGLLLVVGLQFGLVLCLGVYNPLYATYRLEKVNQDLVARTLSAWTVSKNLAIAALTALWGVLASATSPRIAIATAGVLLLATPALLPWRRVGETRSSPIPAAEAAVP
jgi:predicted MFS family arabinose efflux permease